MSVRSEIFFITCIHRILLKTTLNSTFLSNIVGPNDSERHVILQMDEVHIRGDASYKGGKVIGLTI